MPRLGRIVRGGAGRTTAPRPRTLASHSIAGFPLSSRTDAPAGCASGAGGLPDPNPLRMPPGSRICPPSSPEGAPNRPARRTRAQDTRKDRGPTPATSQRFGCGTVRSGPAGPHIAVPDREVRIPGTPRCALPSGGLAAGPEPAGVISPRARAGDGRMPDSSHSGREPGTVIDPIGAGLPEERRRPCAAAGFRGGREVGDVRARRLTAGQATR